ncbi:MAG: cytochrome c maturation protein CcmE [Desulfovibrio sp.]|nr:MAG: cytochrome c maturation protein CcmE [Desulfovibrio sp.]
MSQKSNTYIYVAALVLILGGVAALVASGLSSSLQFLKVAEAVPLMETGELEAARLFGVVDDGGHQDLGEGRIRFTMLDREEPDKMLEVEFGGVLPDTFTPGVEVIVEGRLQPGTSVFEAAMLTTKCPSKYEQYSNQQDS